MGERKTGRSKAGRPREDKEPTEKTSLRVPRSTHEKLKRLAHEETRPINNLINVLINEALAARDAQQ